MNLSLPGRCLITRSGSGPGVAWSVTRDGCCWTAYGVCFCTLKDCPSCGGLDEVRFMAHDAGEPYCRLDAVSIAVDLASL